MTKNLVTTSIHGVAALACTLLATTVFAQAESPGYCDIEAAHNTLLVRPGPGEEPINDINWFARPVPNPDGHWIVGYAMHDQNYLYDLTTGKRVAIPDKSDAVATPDGKYMTVPSFYTPDGFVRFYDTSVLLDHLARGEDASDVQPLFIHEHEGLRQVFYQSLGHVESTPDADVYRMIFSGTMNATGFRMVDYRFASAGGQLTVTSSEPIPLCPEIENDLMTPFISKDGQYVAAYTSPIAEEQYAEGASLKIYRIADINYDNGLAACEEVVDFGFAAGKADFRFDDNSLAFHISNASYLAVFINSGKVYGQGDGAGILNTDVMVANLTRDEDGVINGVSGVRRLTTTDAIGSGSYFPAFFPDGKLYYIYHPLPKMANEPRFEFHVVDPAAGHFDKNLYGDSGAIAAAQEIGGLWTSSCMDTEDYEFAAHELPFFVYTMTAEQCRALVHDADGIPGDERTRLAETCDAILN
ncbi:MAG: hypothetical protein OEM63_06920 [Gammaproteobacteria bacterium]|nr:hypothetical protein [Gammaproteobacteria bacterium]